MRNECYDGVEQITHRYEGWVVGEDFVGDKKNLVADAFLYFYRAANTHPQYCDEHLSVRLSVRRTRAL